MKKKHLLKSFIFTSVLLLGANSIYAVDPPQTLPTAPVHLEENVFSIYSDAYPANSLAAFTFTGTEAEEVNVSGAYMQYAKIGGNGADINYGSASLTFNTPINIDEYDVLYLDIYAVDNDFDLKLTFNSEISSYINVSKIKKGWNTVELELNDYRILAVSPDFSTVDKINITTNYGGRTVFIDNIYACKTTPKDLLSAPSMPAPTPKHKASNVLPIFTDAYPNEIGIQIIATTPGDVKKIKGLKYPANENLDKMYYVENGMNAGDGGLNFLTTVDVSQYDSLHFDLYLVNTLSLPLRFRFGIGDGNIAPNPSSTVKTAIQGWNSIDLNIKDFVALSSTGYNLTAMNGLGFWHKTGGKRTVFVDNIYFYKKDEGPVGISNPDLYQPVEVFPTQIADKLHIKSENAVREIKVISLAGSIVKTLVTNSKELEVNMDHIHRGIYIIQITTTNNCTVTKKVVKL